MNFFKFFFSFLVFIIYVLSHAQGEVKPKFGFKAGVNFSNVNTQTPDEENILTGYHVGVFGKIPINAVIAIQMEAVYTTKGAKLTYHNSVVDGTAKFNLNYIEVPILLVVNFTPHINIHVGPFVAYLTDGKVTNEGEVTLFDFENNIDTDNYNKWDAGIITGLGVDFDAFSLGVRYNYGLTVVGKEDTYNAWTYTFPDGKNNVLSLYLSLALN
jgi:hypothetical protein